MLTFENSPVQGAANIQTKLSELPFAKVEHQIASLDAQPSNETGGILILVTGALLVCGVRKLLAVQQTDILNRWRKRDAQ